MQEELTRVLFGLGLVLLLAQFAGYVASRRRQPAVLGELTLGIALGNLPLLGFHGLAFLRTDAVLDVLAEVGLVLLLFSVGLRSDMRKFLGVGWTAIRVALLGVVAPFVLGFATTAALLPNADPLLHTLVGATLCATSVGITARVLEDLGRLESSEGRIVVGAAVVDDVLGLVLLTVVMALVAARAEGSAWRMAAMAAPLGKAVAFVAIAVIVGLFISPRLLNLAARLRGRRMLLAAALVVCFGLASLANAIGLAAIVGAFAAGVALDDTQYPNAEPHGLEELVQPLTGLLSPLFFVLVGMHVDLSAFASANVLALGAALTVSAVVGKQLCALAVREKGVNRWAVGIGMVPRGEVGLVFASVGATTVLHGAPLFESDVYAATIAMVFATTLLAPALLARALAGQAGVPAVEG